MEVTVTWDPSAWEAQISETFYEGMAAFSEASGHAEFARTHHLDPITFIDNRTLEMVIDTQTTAIGDTVTVWRMTDPGSPEGPRVLAGRTQAVIHMAPGDRDRYEPLRPLIETYATAAIPIAQHNWGRFLTELGTALEQAGPFLPKSITSGLAQTVYPWKSPGLPQFVTLSEAALEENPAMWWSRPTFEQVDVQASAREGGQRATLQESLTHFFGG